MAKINIVEFINRIIEDGSEKNKEEIKQKLVEFKSFLENTVSLTSEELSILSVAITCLDEILSIKEKTGKIIDITSLSYEEKELSPEKNGESKRKIPEIKHYSHYHSESSSSCGSSSSSRGC